MIPASQAVERQAEHPTPVLRPERGALTRSGGGREGRGAGDLRFSRQRPFVRDLPARCATMASVPGNAMLGAEPATAARRCYRSLGLAAPVMPPAPAVPPRPERRAALSCLDPAASPTVRISSVVVSA